ncbi:MAG TPA: cyclic nucleotide-binding domain-containing protein [Pseudomonadales bacterium]
MLRKNLSDYNEHSLQQLGRRIAFFRHLADSDPGQLQCLLSHSVMIELEPGEVLIEKGTRGSEFYALAEGQLAIFPEKRLADTAICELWPGQLVGVLAMLNQQPRTATVAVSSLAGATVFATDFRRFGALEDFSVISLSSKLALLREVVGHIHATLRQCERDVPDAGLSNELATLTDFAGRPGSLDELEHLAEQAAGMVWLLDCWNQRLPARVPMFSEQQLEQQLAGLLQRSAAAGKTLR